MAKSYPKEIFNSIRSYKDGRFKTLSVEALLARDNKVSPLIPPRNSIFKISIFGNDGGVNGNIKEMEVDAIYNASLACINAYFTSDKKDEMEQVPFFAGRFKGKTPAQVILETKDLQVLRDEKAFLKQNLDKFPRNQELIDSINAAAIAYKNGELSEISSPTIIYHSELRPVGKTDDNGLKKVYGIDISYYKGKFQITINNYKAPVDVTDKGAFRVRGGEAVDNKTFSFDLDWNEWLSLIEKCKKTANNYDMLMFRKAWNEAEKLEEEIKNSWRNV